MDASHDPYETCDGVPLFRMPARKIETRWFTLENFNGEKGKGGIANHGRKGSPCRSLAAGESFDLAHIKGNGTIRRIWATLYKRDPESLRGLTIEMYWDGAKKPAVHAPFGDFFCHQLGHMTAFENDCFASPEGRSFLCLVPMPFKSEARIRLVNESGADNGIYYEVDCTVGESHDDRTLYFHAHWRRENYTTLRQDMAILPKIEGTGRFLGCNIGVRQHPQNTGYWWGEGEVKVYLDGDTEYPTLCGTGTEDYLATGYGQGLFSQRSSGCTYISPDKVKYGFHRFHIPDPIYFYKDIHVAIQVMGGPTYKEMLATWEKFPDVRFMKPGDGTKFFTREELEKNPAGSSVIERIDDYSTTAYWYMNAPENALPPLQSAKERTSDL